MGKIQDMQAAHCMQVVKVAHSAAEEKEEQVVGKQLLVDMKMALQVKEVFALSLLEVVSELVGAWLAVQAVEVEVEIWSLGSVENEHFLANQQGQVEETLSSAEEKKYQWFPSDLEIPVQLVACGGLFDVDAHLLVCQGSEEIKAFFALPALGDVGRLVHSGLAMY